jgi:hypothetical protein
LMRRAALRVRERAVERGAGLVHDHCRLEIVNGLNRG